MNRQRFIGYILTCLTLQSFIAASSSWAQGDIEAERRSLRAVSSFYVSATIEGPRALAIEGPVASGAVIDLITKHLRGAGLPVTSPPARHTESELPFLHVHVNMLQVDAALVPFAVEIGFFQDVGLLHDRYELTAATWTEDVLGLVSADNLSSIVGAIEELTRQFVEDFSEANRQP